LIEPIQEVVPKIKVRIEQATKEDLPKFKEIMEEDKYDRFKQRFINGKICFMALNENKVALRMKYSFRSLVYEPG
jgi:hypothetical protein